MKRRMQEKLLRREDEKGKKTPSKCLSSLDGQIRSAPDEPETHYFVELKQGQ